MTSKFVTTRVACNTATASQTITTTALSGAIPIAMFIRVSAGITNGTAADHALLSVGAATSTSTRWTAAMASQDGVTNSNTWRRGATDECIMILNPSDGSVDGEADFTAFVQNGATINWGVLPSAAYLMEVTFITGKNAYAGTFNPNATQDASTDVTAPGFPPNVLFIGANDTLMNDTAGSSGIMGTGYVFYDGISTVEQASHTLFFQDAADNKRGYITGTYGFCSITASALNYALEFGSFDADGFSATTRLNAGDSGDDIGYLAIELTGEDAWVGTIQTKTTTTTQDYTGPSFEPQYVTIVGSHITTLDSFTEGATAGTKTISAFIDGTDEYSTNITGDHGAGTSDEKSLSDNNALTIPYDDGTAGIVASFSQWLSNGFQLSYGTVTGSAHYCIALAIEKARPSLTRGTGRGVLSGVARGVG